jgi:hypothetical protein
MTYPQPITFVMWLGLRARIGRTNLKRGCSRICYGSIALEISYTPQLAIAPERSDQTVFKSSNIMGWKKHCLGVVLAAIAAGCTAETPSSSPKQETKRKNA